jgi:hypothetical protein
MHSGEDRKAIQMFFGQVCLERGCETTPQYRRSHQLPRHDSDVMAVSD